MIVPFVYKAGILRDRTPFQDAYCTDGQWIRFIGGAIKSMKGQQCVKLIGEAFNPLRDTGQVIDHIRIIPYKGTPGADSIIYVVSLSKNTTNGIYIVEAMFNSVTNTITSSRLLYSVPNNASVSSVQSVVFKKDSVMHIGFLLGTSSNYNGGIIGFYSKIIDSADTLVKADLFPAGTSPAKNTGLKGVIYSSPCLFFYGSDGTVLRSRTSDPLNLEGSDSGFVNLLKPENIMFAAHVRGGASSPNFLFWTPTSVIYLSNVANPSLTNLGGEPYDFQQELVSENCSLINEKCVVAFDSLFFWLGTDRIFTYNGIVETVINHVNSDFFFDNVDWNKKHLIYGYSIPRFGEIRWAFPEKSYKDNPKVGCSRELVYNVKENTWYDTRIARSAVGVSELDKSIYSFGKAITLPIGKPNLDNFLWKHEVGVGEQDAENKVSPIPSFFVTPYFGLTWFNPTKKEESIDSYISLDQIEPDIAYPSEVSVTDKGVTVKAYGKRYALQTLELLKTLTLNTVENPDTYRLSFRAQARFLQLRFEFNCCYEVGTILLTFNKGDGK